MNGIGNIKSRLLGKLTESYSNRDKSEMKEIINLVRENKEFVELYLFYEEIEKKYIDDRQIAEQFIAEITPILKSKVEKVSDFCNKLDKKIGNVVEMNVPVYDDLDKLLEEDSLSNIDKKLIARKNLLKHLLTEKDDVVTESTTLVKNENLYHAILVNNFNVLYENELTDDERNELKEFISISDQEIRTKTEELKEEILGKVSSLLVEDADQTLVQKLEDVKNEVTRMKPTKYNLYKLQQLKSGLV